MSKCRKYRYDSQAEAEARLNIIAPSQGDFSMTAYRCNRCGFWHVGHKSPELKAEGVIRTQILDLEARLRHARRHATIERIRENLSKLRAQLRKVTGENESMNDWITPADKHMRETAAAKALNLALTNKKETPSEEGANE